MINPPVSRTVSMVLASPGDKSEGTAWCAYVIDRVPNIVVTKVRKIRLAAIRCKAFGNLDTDMSDHRSLQSLQS